jgi:hypothetical protein
VYEESRSFKSIAELQLKTEYERYSEFSRRDTEIEDDKFVVAIASGIAFSTIFAAA